MGSQVTLIGLGKVAVADRAVVPVDVRENSRERLSEGPHLVEGAARDITERREVGEDLYALRLKCSEALSVGSGALEVIGIGGPALI